VAGVASLNNFPRKAMSQFAGVFSKSKDSPRVSPVALNPQFTFPDSNCGGNCYAVGPYDFATIYNVLPLWNANIDGTGQTIAIVGRTNINIQDVRDFRSLFGLPANDPNIILNGPDPGINGDEGEADIDVQWSGAVAKNATIDFVVSESTETTDGIDLSAEYIIDNNLAPVMSESYGACELGLGTAGNQFYSALWEQAAAQGITVMVSSGDSGSAGCDFNQGSVPQPAQYGLAVNGIGSTPFNVSVGGTDFYDFSNPNTYWSTSNDPVTQQSALSYIPESTWNDSCSNALWAQVGFSTNAETNCNDSQLLGAVDTIGGSGGLSNCTTNSQQLGSCSGGYPKPSWQTGTGVPSDNKRDLPDVSLFASNGFVGSFYIVCQSDISSSGTCNLNNPIYDLAGYGGTSVSAPAFAGIMALVNQQEGVRQGNANFVMYKLAAQQSPVNCNSATGSGSTCAFNDITTGTIAMPCASGSTNCTTNTAGHQYGILSGYSTTTGYDLATGLGSINAYNFVNNWHTVTFTASTTALTLTPTTGITHGQSVNLTVNVTPSSGTGTPTGDVSLLTSTGQAVDGFTLSVGKVTGTTTLLPGGTYNVTAHYAGDSKFGGSDSNAVSVTVAKENSKTALHLITFDPITGQIINSNATSAVYGSPYILRADVTNSAGTACGPLGGCPTGTLTLTDNGNPLDLGSYTLNSLGYTEDQLVQFPGGTNAVQANYAGDNSFNASSGSSSFNITPAVTTIAAPTVSANLGSSSVISTTVQATSSGAAPSGTVTFFANGTLLTGPTQYLPTSGATNGTAMLQAILFTNFSNAGTYNITAMYNGDTNYGASTSGATTVSLKYPVFQLNVQSSSYNVNAGSSVTATATVATSLTGVTVAPTGTVTFSSALGPITGNVTYSTVTDPNTGSTDLEAMITFVPNATDAVNASYSGDANYEAAQGVSPLVTVNGSDFGLYFPTPSITVPQGGSAQVTLDVGLQTGASPVMFGSSACSGLPAEASCALPSSVSYTSGNILTVSTTLPHARAQAASSGRMPLLWSMSLTFVGLVLIGSLRKPRNKSTILGILTICFLLFAPGCGGGYSASPGGNAIDPGTPKGNYTVTVTGTSGSITHTATFTLTVQ
jgi:hypothetical protein